MARAGSREPPSIGMAGSLSRAFSSLRHRDFLYLAGGSLALGFGQWFQMIGMGWLVLQATGSPFQMAAVTSLRGTVSVLAAPLGGVLSDRLNRRDVAAWSTGAASLQALALSLLVLSGRVELWALYLFAGLEGLAAGVYMTARQALVFNVVPQESLPNAVAMNSVFQNLARISGPALAGAVIGLTGTAGSAFVILAVVKLLAVALTVPIRGVPKERAAGPQEAPWVSVMEGVRYSIKDPVIVSLIILSVIPSLLVFPYVQMLPFFAEEALHSGATGYGLLATAVGWGSLVGLGWLVLAGNVRRKGLVALVTLFLYVVFVAAFARSTVFGLSMAFLVLAGIFNAVSMTLTTTLLQLIVSDEFRGRVFALYSASHGVQPLGALPMGLAIEAWGPANGVFGFMIIAALLVLVTAVLARPLRNTPT